MGKSSPSTPEIPDYEELAEDQAAINAKATQVGTFANRPNQVTPYGSSEWKWNTRTDPLTGEPVLEWTQTNELDPGLQSALESQIGFTEDVSGLAGGMFGNIADAYANPYDPSGLRQISELEDPLAYRDRAESAVYDRYTSRLDDRYSQDEEALQSRLYNQGLRPGDEAYDAEMQTFGEGRTDAYQAAMNEAVGAGREESALLYGQQLEEQAQSAALREQQYVEELRNRNMPLFEAQALLEGQGIPSIDGFGFTPASTASGADIYGAGQDSYLGAIDAYNAEQAASQGKMSGLSSLAKLGITAAGSIFGGPPGAAATTVATDALWT